MLTRRAGSHGLHPEQSDGGLHERSQFIGVTGHAGSAGPGTANRPCRSHRYPKRRCTQHHVSMEGDEAEGSDQFRLAAARDGGGAGLPGRVQDDPTAETEPVLDALAPGRRKAGTVAWSAP